MRTADAVSPHLDTGMVALILVSIVALYAALFWVFVRFVRKTVIEGPSFALPPSRRAEPVLS
jgi:cytochrome bd-type quinol oxidase subunit 1